MQQPCHILLSHCAVKIFILLLALFSPCIVAAQSAFLLSTDKACYTPGQTVVFTFSGTLPSSAIVRYRHGIDIVGEQRLSDIAVGGSWQWTPPATDFTGYMAEVCTVADGTEQHVAAIAVDVSSDWTRFPRYGFVAEFDNYNNTIDKNANIEAEMRYLNRLHINGVQFQDWHWMHHRPVRFRADGTFDPWYQDISNRWIGTEYVKKYIEVQHRYGMKSIFYNLCFGAWKNYEADGVKKEWGLYKKDSNGNLRQDYHGLPSSWQSDIFLMNPGNPDWQNYLADRNDEVYANYDFDGYQIDQLGWRADHLFAYNNDNIDLPYNYGLFIDAMKRRHPDKRLIMNAVGSYGSQNIAGKDVDFCYNETWGGEAGFSNLFDIIKANDSYSGHRLQTVFASYINYDKADNGGSGDRLVNTPGVLLTDAVMFAIGGSHLEMGDHMLTREYFPAKPLAMTDELKERLIYYYDFHTAYQNLLRGTTSSSAYDAKVSIDGIPANTWPPQAYKVTTFAKHCGTADVMHLLNFLNTADLSWRDLNGTRPAPVTQHDLRVSVATTRRVKRVWTASPDVDGGIPHQLDFTQEAGTLTFTLPSLEYWSMVVIENAEEHLILTGEAVADDSGSAYDLSKGIYMEKHSDENIFKATAFLKGGELFKFANGTDWGSCVSYNAAHPDCCFSDNLTTADIVSHSPHDHKFQVLQSSNYDIRVDLDAMTVSVARSAWQTTPADRYPALYLVGDHCGWRLSEADPIRAADPQQPHILTATVRLHKGDTFKFATRRFDGDWQQPMFVMGDTPGTMTLWDHTDAGDRKWKAEADGDYAIRIDKQTNTVSITSVAAGMTQTAGHDKAGNTKAYTLAGIQTSVGIAGITISNGRKRLAHHSHAVR